MRSKERATKGKGKGNSQPSKPNDNGESSKKNNQNNRKHKGGEGTSKGDFVTTAECSTQRRPKHGNPTYDEIMKGTCTFHRPNAQYATRDCIFLKKFTVGQFSASGLADKDLLPPPCKDKDKFLEQKGCLVIFRGHESR